MSVGGSFPRPAQRSASPQIPLLVSPGPPSSLNEPGGGRSRWLGGCRGDLLLVGSAPVTKGAGVQVRMDCRRDGYNAFG